LLDISLGEFEMKKLCDLYIRYAGFIGVLFCAVPNLAWFIGGLFLVPFREVYLLRLALSLAIGCPIAAYLNRYGVDIWLLKHRSTKGPATIFDGSLVGAAIGIGCALLPTLTIFIASNHVEIAKNLVIITYLSAAFIGVILGAILATIARKYVN
jgi:hypothetical protein